MKTKSTKLSYMIELPKIVDEGYLSFLEGMTHVPFLIKRVYFITHVDDGAKRGFHAHKNTQQALFCIHGSVLVTLDNGHTRESIRLDESHKGIFLDSMMWHEMSEFHDDTVLLIVASDVYKETDYIRSYTQFLSLTTRQ